MSSTPPATGRRERNKQDKLDRIAAAASELFAERGVDDVTTQEIADRADIGTGTLFLYAKTKGELLLMVQNSAYEDALRDGVRAAESESDALAAVLAILRPVVECNRKQVDNGRTYLREIAFGDVNEPYHRTAFELSVRTQQAVADVLRRSSSPRPDMADEQAQVVSAIMFVTLAVVTNAGRPVEEIVEEIRAQVRVLLGV